MVHDEDFTWTFLFDPLSTDLHEDVLFESLDFQGILCCGASCLSVNSSSKIHTSTLAEPAESCQDILNI